MKRAYRLTVTFTTEVEPPEVGRALLGEIGGSGLVADLLMGLAERTRAHEIMMLGSSLFMEGTAA